MQIRSFLMDNYAKLCKLSKSSHPALAVVLTCPVHTVYVIPVRTRFVPTENGVDTYFQSCLINDSADP